MTLEESARAALEVLAYLACVVAFTCGALLGKAMSR